VPGMGLTEAGSIVVLLALGVAILDADWRERVGEAGGETSQSWVAVSISSRKGIGGFFFFFFFFFISYIRS